MTWNELKKKLDIILSSSSSTKLSISANTLKDLAEYGLVPNALLEARGPW